MPFEKRTRKFQVECEHVAIVKDGSVADDFFICSHKGQGFLYAKRGAVEHFEIPQAEEQEQPEEQAEEQA